MDLSQVCVANLMTLMIGSELNIDMLRHMILNTIRFNNLKFRAEFGSLVLATDAKRSWRKDQFAYYKANREKDRKESPIDWASYFQMIEQLKSEIATAFPYPLVAVDGAEGDDIIGVLSTYIATKTKEKVLILSGDKDFIQLQVNPLISQFNPVSKEDIFHNEPAFFKFKHIVKGDRIDGVPNIRSADDCFITKIRQKSMYDTEIREWFDAGSVVPDELHDKYVRNKKLIDLEGTPVHIAKEIVANYKAQIGKPSNVMEYMMDNRLSKLITTLKDFEEL